ncbi:MAG: YgiQ family radical SAM protein [Sphaerochaetaceae bacterium]|jgi:uncharacterized radical SAM protein YgiQ|nr:YgiQ family radical SAM protein [Sphaerochaetaceae bacterium]NLO59541.1 YgiQ family radical SAM protein [Spirochaetales bacterium]MDD2405676.1 YgiQ family radical SAM protein [Sphaerochaetaceae bacterium]MDD3669976.1 YgiQ family radical SAM protein [Sphaerochaetaceae bacterium]MDD4258418.1 YgiQ family radical SAM protein [Sphaerochaetaceae bacterium]
MWIMNSRTAFLPMNREDLDNRGWDEVDVVFVTGDAYVDHPSFAAALLGRLMESEGYRVGIVAQPKWDRPDDFLALGKPRLCCMISSGAIDSMVAHYTAHKKVRNDDPYSPGGKAGFRPDRALITYCGRARQAFGQDTPIIIGGLEASLRKFAHYDYWSDTVRRNILFDAKADMLVYGMGEYQTLEILSRLASGNAISSIIDIRGTCVGMSQSTFSHLKDMKRIHCIELPSYEEVSLRDPKSNTPAESAKRDYAKAFQLQMLHENPMGNDVIVQKSNDRYLWCNPPAYSIDQDLFDRIHEFSYTRDYHPDYSLQGGIPALSEVQFSLTSNRGCFGSCSFCAITSHQGRIISVRSTQSLVREAKTLTRHPDFKGYIHDVGGPTANFQGLACDMQASKGPCSAKFCLYPHPCKNLVDHHETYLEKLEAIASIKNVKKVFIRSGIRYDYLLSAAKEETQRRFIEKLAKDHVSGQLRIAPEHVAEGTLDAMGKANFEYYEEFVQKFNHASERFNLKQYCIPYFIAAHPGTTLDDAIELALYLKQARFIPEQVQEFYPTPQTVATCMYFTGIDPRPSKQFASVYVPKGRERSWQRALLHYHKAENRKLIIEALTEARRKDLINVLIPLRKPAIKGT